MADHPAREQVEEVRVAIALNGGVSLAVWMGGAAVELDAARRAHLPGDERPVYSAICRAFQRELVLDLMTGSSAGGINGALLAGAVAWRRRLAPDFLREKWMRLGDFGCLLRPLSTSRPQSLMRGEYFHDELSTTFAELRSGEFGTALEPEQDAARAQLADQVRLEVTTTDMAGQERRYRDVWDEDLVAHEYRHRFRFEGELDPADLAVAARSSASFPVAFEPFTVRPGMLPGLKGERHVLDGGLLDNAPIKAVLDLIPSRAATRQVRRYVCYVNADPPLAEQEPAAGAPKRPGLGPVVTAVVGLPRKATFVDHLQAIRVATRQGALAGTGEQDLLRLEREALRATATALLDAYRRRRRVVSLEDVLADARDVDRTDRKLQALPRGLDLPWIPTSLAPPPPGRWGWGVRAAQRALHLIIDTMRAAVPGHGPADRVRLFTARSRIDKRLARLDGIHRAVTHDPQVADLVTSLPEDDDVEGTVRALHALTRAGDGAVRRAVWACAQQTRWVADLLDEEVVRGLFGTDRSGGTLTGPQFEAFLERVLAIEVVRRAFHAEDLFDTAQRLHFAQLTPCAPALLLSSTPLKWPHPASIPKAKLTGLPVAHFAAFHRSSWRANDFMWGRLDGAVRVVDMLVDAARAVEVADDLAGDAPWDVLAEHLVSDRSPAARALLLEALDGAGRDAVEDEEALRTRLRLRLRADLREGEGALTRVLCARALQLEILQVELPKVVRASEEDAALGTSTAALDVPKDPLEAIDDLRAGPPLPARLGVHRSELASDLALLTLSRAALIGVAAVRTAGIPLGAAIGALRAPLLPIAGTVARGALRLAVAVAYTAFVLWLAWRALATADGDALRPPQHPDIDDLSVWTVAVTMLAVLGVLVLASIAGWRAYQVRGARARLWYGGAAALLAAAGLLVPLGGAMLAGGLEVDELLAQRGAPTVPQVLLILVVGTSLGIPALIALGAGRLVDRRLVAALLRRTSLGRRLEVLASTPYAGWPTLGFVLLPWVVLGIYAGLGLAEQDAGSWRTLALLAAGLAPVLAAVLLLAPAPPQAMRVRPLGLTPLSPRKPAGAVIADGRDQL